MNLSSIADELEARFRAHGNPERAEQEKRYLKSDMEFAGATVWQVDAEMKTWATAHPGLAHDELVALVLELWSRPPFERRMAAVMALERSTRLLSPADLDLVERLVRESGTWALVDGLAANVVGGILQADRASVEPVLDRWAVDPDFWVRRTSLLAELRPLRTGVELQPFLRRAELMLDEKEFFIRKAIGWVLRDVGKRRPAEVIAWIAPRTHRASGVTMREVVKYLPKADAERLMAAYRERRPAT